MNIKKSIIATSAALLIGASSAYAGWVAGQNSVQEEADQRIEYAKLQIAKMQQSYVAELANMERHIQAIEDEQRSQVTERFVITKIENGNVLGELAEGSGEGINYPLDMFHGFGIMSLSVGDLVDITWPEAAYDNSEWDDIDGIELIN